MQPCPSPTLVPMINYECVKFNAHRKGIDVPSCEIVKFFHQHLDKVKKNLEGAMQDDHKRFQNIEVIFLPPSQIDERKEKWFPIKGEELFLQALPAHTAKEEVFAKLGRRLDESLEKNLKVLLSLSLS